MIRDLKFIESLSTNQSKSFFSKLNYYVYAICEIDSDNKRLPIYIGKGKNDRCLQHFSDKKKSEKVSKINELKNSGRLGIDILAYDLDEKTSFALESACIDLLNIDNLTNSVRGHGVNTKRLPIYELASKLSEEKVTIPHDHRGVAYLLEKTYKHDFGDLAILEHTRGIWNINIQKT